MENLTLTGFRVGPLDPNTKAFKVGASVEIKKDRSSGANPQFLNKVSI
jgi:hypothetical protein